MIMLMTCLPIFESFQGIVRMCLCVDSISMMFRLLLILFCFSGWYYVPYLFVCVCVQVMVESTNCLNMYAHAS